VKDTFFTPAPELRLGVDTMFLRVVSATYKEINLKTGCPVLALLGRDAEP
jgi:hypothetical protein